MELSYAVGMAVTGVVEGAVDSAVSALTTCAVGPAVVVLPVVVASSFCCNTRRIGRVGSPPEKVGDCTAYVGGRTISDEYTGGSNGTNVVGETVGIATSVVVVVVVVVMALEML